MTPLREVLKEYYLEYLNNYLTVEVFAEHNNIGIELAMDILKTGKEYHHEDSAEENNLNDFSRKGK